MIEPYTAEELAELRAETTSYLDTEPMYARVGPRTVARLLATIAKLEADARRAALEEAAALAHATLPWCYACLGRDQFIDELEQRSALLDAGRGT